MEGACYSRGDRNTAAERSENSALLRKRPSVLSVWGRRYRRSDKCISSKAALLVLLWGFIVVATYGIVYNRAGYMMFINLYPDIFGFGDGPAPNKAFVITILYAISAGIPCFYPLAGYLADNKFGRYKTVIRSLYVLLLVVFIFNIFGVVVLPFYFVYLKPNLSENYTVLRVLLAIGGSALFASTVSFVGINANIIQFGMDQLHDSPGDHQSLFIHWFTWVYYLGIFSGQLGVDVIYYLNIDDVLHYCLLAFSVLLYIAYMVILLVSLCLAHHKRGWFIVDSARPNPYKLVYRVTKFSRHHKVPVHRSAFTFCEDEVPSGLDLGKGKYGGPFSTEQVEDVKAFYGILKVLFALSPVFLFSIGTDPLLYFYAVHGSQYNATFTLNGAHHSHEVAGQLLIQNGLLSQILKVVCIPFYLCLLRPFISGYIPRMLRRMGIGIGLVVLSLICTFLMDTAAHAQDKNADMCMFSYESINSTAAATLYASFQDSSALIIQRCLKALSDMLIDIALYEFICAQSPHSMKGLLIGLSFAIRGFFEGIAAVIMIPFFFIKTSFPSCGMEYYLMNIPLSVVTLLLYICVARRYKFRERDEPCNVRRYVEDYYSKKEDIILSDRYDAIYDDLFGTVGMLN